jgi:hypothetical protein
MIAWRKTTHRGTQAALRSVNSTLPAQDHSNGRAQSSRRPAKGENAARLTRASRLGRADKAGRKKDAKTLHEILGAAQSATEACRVNSEQSPSPAQSPSTHQARDTVAFTGNTGRGAMGRTRLPSCSYKQNRLFIVGSIEGFIVLLGFDRTIRLCRARHAPPCPQTRNGFNYLDSRKSFLHGVGVLSKTV